MTDSKYERLPHAGDFERENGTEIVYLSPLPIPTGMPAYSSRNLHREANEVYLDFAIGQGNYEFMARCGIAAVMGVISTFMLGLFGSSLLHGMPIAERLARLQEPDLPARAVQYTRRVTQVWCLFFLLNGLIAAGLTLWAPLSWWTLYNGLIAYIAMGLLFAGEWLTRQRVRGRP